MNEEDDAIELSKDELSTLKDLIRMYKLGKKTAVQAIVTALVGILFSALTYGAIHWIRTIAAGAGAVLLLGAAGVL